jgi:hypothetical protein
MLNLPFAYSHYQTEMQICGEIGAFVKELDRIKEPHPLPLPLERGRNYLIGCCKDS